MTESSSSFKARPVRKPAVSRSRRHSTFDGDTPRPMTALANAMLERRRRSAGPIPSSVPARGSDNQVPPVVLQAVDGAVSYALTPRHPGLQVDRTTRSRTDLHVSQTIVFSDREAFDQWCDSDPVRFQQPLLHAQLKKQGGELLHEQRTTRPIP